MSETAYERGYRVGQTQGGEGGGSASTGSSRTGGNILLQKYGPLPVWAWMAIGFLAILLVYLWRKNSSANANAGTTGTGATTSSSLIPQFVNQVYTSGEPPEDENNGPPGTPPPKKTKDPTSTQIANNHLTPISPGQATELLKKKERPFIWNGTGFEAATKIAKNVQYYAGQLETEQLNAENDAKSHPIAKRPVHHTQRPPSKGVRSGGSGGPVK